MNIKPGIYEHYKGNHYRVIDVATHSETEEKLVVYQPMYGDMALWVRPLGMFIEMVEINTVQVPRFKFLHSEE